MSHSYPSDISREQFARILPTLESVRRRTKPRTVDLYDVFCGVLYLLKSGCQWRMLPADFPDWRTCYKYFRQWSERPGPDEDSILEQVGKKNWLARPGKQWTERADQLLYRGLPEREDTDSAGNKGYDAGKKVSFKRHIAVDTQGLPHAIHITTANVTDRAGALAMFDRHRDGLNQVQNVLVDGGYTGKPFAAPAKPVGSRGGSGETPNCTPSWCCRRDGWWSGLSLGWRSAAGSGRTAIRKLNTSLQMVVLASQR